MAVGITDVFEVADPKQIATMARNTFDKYCFFLSNFHLLDFFFRIIV